MWLERHLDGLDKMYRLHKWLGIGALVVGTVHWLWAKGTKWAVGWGWLTKPARGAGGGAAELGAIEAALRGWRGTAETMGEWAFYGAVLLIVLALVKRFPYRLFAKTHKLLAVAYLVLVFHTAVLTKIDYWAQPVGWVQAVLLVAGTVSAVIVLLGRIGARRTAHGTIESLKRFPALHMLETTLLLDERWAGHQPGQFAFLTSSAAEGAHPYTIASAWNPQDRRISFVTKALGDHTGTLHERLRVGDRVKIEGPYGHFTFEGDAPQQIWIGAGIGITPFIARMKHLAQAGARGPTVVDLFHPTAAIDPAALQKLQANARAAGVRLHLLVDGQDEPDRRTPAPDGARLEERQRVVLRPRRLWPGAACRPDRAGLAGRCLPPGAVPDAENDGRASPLRPERVATQRPPPSVGAGWPAMTASP